ncbi:MAG TPA: hypothetical protein VEV62_16800 [Parafilimonas sp.]|nr:hypothetical protein [Parafilimonas sp.]
MKKISFNFCLLLTLCVIITSCKKNGAENSMTPPASGRTFRFVLYTDQDFSNDNSVIHFTLFIKKGSVYVYEPNQNNLVYDSAFATMQIKDIPDAAHKIVVEKKVVGYDDTDFSAGFVYEIENVGNSWHVDTSSAGNPLKIIEYNFR